MRISDKIRLLLLCGGAEKEIYTITPTLVNCTASSENPTTIEQGGTATLQFYFNTTSYICPEDSPTVMGATGTWEKVNNGLGIMTLSNPTADITFTVTGSAISEGYTVNYTYSQGSASDYDMYFIIDGEERAISLYEDSQNENVTRIHFYNYDDPLKVYINETLVHDGFADEYSFDLTGDANIVGDFVMGGYIITMQGTPFAPGLYDENNNLLASYQTSGLVADYDYTSSYKTEDGSGYKTLQTYPLTRKIVLPDSLLKIGYRAFQNCDNLESVILPSSIVGIRNYAFSGCANLENIILPEGVTYIDFDAFADCVSLEIMEFPSTTNDINQSAFRGCTKLNAVSVDSSNTVYHSAGNCVIKTDTRELIVGCNTSIIPNNATVTSIGNYAFSGRDIRNITIPDNITSIGNWAFYSCETLESITIGDGVTNIGLSAFSICKALTTIYIPSSVVNVGISAFSGCNQLTNVIFDNDSTLESIPRQSFQLCNNLESITIPASVVSIGQQAFQYCQHLTDITFRGTKSQWNAITKGAKWNELTGNYTVHCTDGDIPKYAGYTVQVTLYGRRYEYPDDSQFTITSGSKVWQIELPTAGARGYIYSPSGESWTLDYDSGYTFSIDDAQSLVITSTANADYSLNGASAQSLSGGVTLSITQNSTLRIGYDYDT